MQIHCNVGAETWPPNCFSFWVCILLYAEVSFLSNCCPFQQIGVATSSSSSILDRTFLMLHPRQVDHPTKVLSIKPEIIRDRTGCSGILQIMAEESKYSQWISFHMYSIFLFTFIWLYCLSLFIVTLVTVACINIFIVSYLILACLMIYCMNFPSVRLSVGDHCKLFCGW